MTTMNIAREVVSRHFVNIKNVDEQVIRGEKRHGDKCYAVAYVDFSDDIEERARHLEEFQERVMGDDFFSSPEQLRWNNYLYIVAGPDSVSKQGFAAAKARIEADKEFARKRVVLADELEDVLGDSKLFDTKNLAKPKDVVAEWSGLLTKAGLDVLLDKPTPRTEIVERIGRRNAARKSSPAKAKALPPIDEQLSKSHLRSLEITRFRPVHDGKTYSFGAVTLIVGPNGTGKTSLLEAIEHLYCGFNRRPNEASGQNFSLKGLCSNLKTSQTFEVAATSDAGRIKARCLAWYRREERQAKQIIEGFTRYNFLDTDAAFRLSVELEPGEISKDLSRLLIGEEASTLWEYLGKITADLENAWSKSCDRLDGERERAALLEAEYKRLQQLPSQGNTLSTSYRAELAAVGWINISIGVGLATESERVPLNTAIQHLNVLLATNALGATTRGGIKARLEDVDGAFTKATEFQLNLSDLEKQVKKTIDESSNLKAEVDVLNKWLPYCTAGFGQALAARDAAQVVVENARSILGRFVSWNGSQAIAEIAKVSIAAAEATTHEEIRSLTASVSSLETSAQRFGQIESARAHAAQQLKDAALLLFQHGHAAGECPLCSTKHDPSELISKIEAITGKATSSIELKDINQSLEFNRNALVRSRQRLQELATVREVAEQLRISTSTPVEEVIEHLGAVRSELDSAVLNLNKARETLTALELSGLSKREYDALRARVNVLFEDAEDIESPEISAALRDKTELLRQKSESKLLSLRAEMEVASTKISSVVDELDSPDWPKISSQTRDVNSLIELKNYVKKLLDHAKSLAEFIRFDDGTSFTELRQSLLGVTKALDDALHAVASEAEASSSLKVAEDNLNESKRRIQNLQEQTENQKAALDTLKRLIQESSLTGATQDALSTISHQINDVFGRIHAPLEYEYNDDGERLLRTRAHQQPRTLEQVSTGQRAAFALSIFLALNLTAQSAPPVLLIDDPIAHIDDLNALSFMDYLRELAVNSKRQIFFATADSRIAALFTKKFAFLGADQFKTIQLSRGAAS